MSQHDEPQALTLTLSRQGSADCVVVPSLSAVLMSPSGSEQRTRLGLITLAIGSDPGCALVATDSGVSRRHCTLSLTGRGIQVKDLESKNGTFINGVRVFEALLPVGGSLSIGRSQVRIVHDGPAERVELSAAPQFGAALGASVAMRALFAKLERAAKGTDSIVLLGESGTGKEVLARALHQASPRAQGPFAVLDCGAVSPQLIESELFGHLKGAFTGAAQAHTGVFEEANGGTLFLDEIGELPIEMQPRLLRALETHQVRPLGSNTWRSLDVRVVAATHRNLQALVDKQTFRADLYYRLAALEVLIPPLRERKDDLPLLAERILSQRIPPATLKDLPPNAMDLLQAHAWPGNVRELKNTLERFMVLSDPSDAVQLLGPKLASTENPLLALPLRDARNAAVTEFEKIYLEAHLQRCGGSVSAAAKAMGVSRQFAYRLVARYGLRSPNDESEDSVTDSNDE